MLLSTLYESMHDQDYTWEDAKNIGKNNGLYISIENNKISFYKIVDGKYETIKQLLDTKQHRELAKQYLVSMHIDHQNEPLDLADSLYVNAMWEPLTHKTIVYKATNNYNTIPGFTTSDLDQARKYKDYYNTKYVIQITLDGKQRKIDDSIILRGPKGLTSGFYPITIHKGSAAVLKNKEKDEIIVLYKPDPDDIKIIDV